jgi:antitoxin component of MazEF toxin-antitoxin module
MGYVTKVQVIKRANNTRQFYLICPAPLAQALEMEQGEEIEWVVEDRNTLILRRPPAPKRGRKRGKRGR